MQSCTEAGSDFEPSSTSSTGKYPAEAEGPYPVLAAPNGLFGPYYAYIPVCTPGGAAYSVAGPYYKNASGSWFGMAFDCGPAPCR
jgi:hypothetical protein